MSPVPPPQGVSEADYETIEAAVTETVRGRWFLSEFARRNRSAEMRQLLDAMSRLEGTIAQRQGALPAPTDPSIRLLMQRVKEIAGQLDMLSIDLREAGVDERFAAAVEKQARAVSGMMRGAPLPKPSAARAIAAMPEPRLEPPGTVRPGTPADPRLALLADLDALPMLDKLALFA